MWQLTCAFKLLCRRGEQQFALHAVRAGTAGDAGLFVAGLHPVGQPSQAAITVQRVGADGPDETQKTSVLVTQSRRNAVSHYTKFTTKVMRFEKSILYFFSTWSFLREKWLNG